MRTSTRPLVDRLMDGKLTQELTRWRSEGDSYETIARRLHDDGVTTVSGATIARWCVELDVPTDPAQVAS